MNDWLQNFFRTFGIPDDVFPMFEYSPWQTMMKPRRTTPPGAMPVMPQPQQSPTSFPMFEPPPDPMMEMMMGQMGGGPPMGGPPMPPQMPPRM